MSNERIRVNTSIPSLRKKVQTNIEGSSDVVHWYIRFNIPLDESTVSYKTMSVTDTEGYIMRTEISYSPNGNAIIISPLDTYEQNRFYILNISKKVRSARGRQLRSTIYIVFKLYDNQISEYRVLKKDVKVPKPRPRPKDYDQKQQNRRPVVDPEYLERAPLYRMSTVSFRFNPLVAVAGVVVAGAGLLLDNWLVGVVGMLSCIAGAVHIFLQLRKDEVRSKMLFNKGARLFNRGRYNEAERAFKGALVYDPGNELAEYGIYKIGLYNK
jgi:tetratricopeptide (TPR) repeat protein